LDDYHYHNQLHCDIVDKCVVEKNDEIPKEGCKVSLEVSIKKRFPDFTLDVSFSAGMQAFGFLGESGCGKTLTLRCIAGIETPDEGRIVVNGTTYFDSEKNIKLSPQQRKTALLFQNYMLFPNLSVLQNIACGIGKSVSKQERDCLAQAELKRFSLVGFEKRYPAQLSGGQQQRVALARMLAARPGILMLDEPFSALDAHLKGVLEQNLVSLFEAFSGPILYISHDIDEALRFCDRIAVVDKGKIVEESSGEDLVNNPQSLAAMKLSGCKNVTPALYLGPHHVRLLEWGIDLSTEKVVPKNVAYLGVRAQYIESAQSLEAKSENVFRVRVRRVSDSRFDRTALLSFKERIDEATPEVSDNTDEMKYLHQHLFWRMNKPAGSLEKLPTKDEELFIHIPKDKLYLTVC
jgi:molybdate transport system ATP-binding protein